MDSELQQQEEEFESKMEEWIARQGIFFQMKHATSAGSILPKVMSLVFRLFILLIILALVFWLYLKARPSMDSFKNDVLSQVMTSTGAAGGEIVSISRHKGGLFDAQMKISSLELVSSDKTFFEDWYEKGVDLNERGDRIEVEEKKHLTVSTAIVAPLGIGDGLFSGWSGNELEISGLKCHLKIGAQTDEQALANLAGMFQNYESLQVNYINFIDADISWGYGRNRGSVKESNIVATRTGDVWQFVLNGGTFSQGWIKEATLSSMQIECHKSGLVNVSEMKLSYGGGTLSAKAEIMITSDPEIEGSYEFKGVKLKSLMGPEYTQYLDGKIDGQGELSGSFKTSKGIITKTNVELKATPREYTVNQDNWGSNRKIKNNSLILKGGFPLFKTLQNMNPGFSFAEIPLTTGKFTLMHNGQEMKISQLDVRAGQLMIVKGELGYRWGSYEENDLNEVDLDSLSLSELAEKNEQAEAEVDFAFEEKKLEKKYYGALKIGFVPDVFERHPEVYQVYPEDMDTARVWLDVKTEGRLNNLSIGISDQLEKIVREAREARN